MMAVPVIPHRCVKKGPSCEWGVTKSFVRDDRDANSIISWMTSYGFVERQMLLSVGRAQDSVEHLISGVTKT
jgi:hypothetical protein